MAGVSLGGDIRRLMHHLRKLETLDLKGINENLAQIVRTSTRKRFRDQRGPDDAAWQPSDRVETEGGVTLTQTARLRNSIRARADETGFAVGTNVIYARRHQLGDPKPVTIRAKSSHGLRFQVGGRWITKGSVKVQLPARPFLGLSKEDLEEIKAELEAVAGA